MRKTYPNIASILVSGILAASETLFLGWPSRVSAVGGEEQAIQEQGELAQKQTAPANVNLAQNESKIGDLEVTATLATSETAPSRQVIRLECRNATEGPIKGKIQVALTRTNGNSMERVMPQPQIAWRHPETVEVAPGETLVREIVIPKNISTEVARIEKARKTAEESDTAPFPRVYFGVTAEPIEVKGTQRDVARSKSSSSKVLVMPLVPPAPPRLYKKLSHADFDSRF